MGFVIIPYGIGSDVVLHRPVRKPHGGICIGIENLIRHHFSEPVDEKPFVLPKAALDALESAHRLHGIVLKGHRQGVSGVFPECFERWVIKELHHFLPVIEDRLVEHIFGEIIEITLFLVDKLKELFRHVITAQFIIIHFEHYGKHLLIGTGAVVLEEILNGFLHSGSGFLHNRFFCIFFQHLVYGPHFLR